MKSTGYFSKVLRFLQVAVLTIGFGYPLTSSIRAAAVQEVTIHPGTNYLAINIVVSQNELQQLFPDAPVGTLVFAFSNSSGFAVSQMTAAGWSNPALRIAPLHGAIIILPFSGARYSRSLAGEYPVEPPVVYEGWSLISAKTLLAEPPLRVEPKEADIVFAFRKETIPDAYYHFPRANYNAGWHYYDGYNGIFHDKLFDLSDTEAVWYFNAKGNGIRPSNPAGSFGAGGCVYLNNYVPALGIDAPFITSEGCALTGTVQLYEVIFGGIKVPIGSPAVIGPGGYLNTASNLMRYTQEGGFTRVILEVVSQEAVRTIDLDIRTDSPAFPPGVLQGLQFPPLRLSFVQQPQDTLVALRSNATLSATFNYAGSGAAPGNSMKEAWLCSMGGLRERAPIEFQWERQDQTLNWINVPGATNDTLSITSIQASDFGDYRLIANWGEHLAISSAASIAPRLVADIADQTVMEGASITLPSLALSDNPDDLIFALVTPSGLPYQIVGDGPAEALVIGPFSEPSSGDFHTVNLLVSDGNWAQNVSFRVKVIPPPENRLFSPIPDQVLNLRTDSTSLMVPLIVDSNKWDSMTFKTSWDTNVLSSVSVVEANAIWIYAKSIFFTGSTRVELEATDGIVTQRQSFLVTIIKPPEPPRIVPPVALLSFLASANQRSDFDLPIRDPDTALADLVFSVQNHSPEIVRSATVSVREGRVILSVETSETFGNASIVVQTSDGDSIVPFLITLQNDTPADDPPEILGLGNTSVIRPGGLKLRFHFTVRDLDTPATKFRISAHARTTNLYSNLDITVDEFPVPGGPSYERGCSVSMDWEFGAYGSDEITIIVSDGTSEVNRTITYSVENADSPTVLFDPIPDMEYSSEPIRLHATSTRELLIRFTVVDGPATVENDLLTLTGTGRVIVSAYEPFTDGGTLRSFEVLPKKQWISLAVSGTARFGGAPLQLVAEASSRLPVQLEVISGKGAITNGMLRLDGAGPITIRATQPGNDIFAAAPPVEQTVNVEKAEQALEFRPLPAFRFGDSLSLQALTSSGLEAVFDVLSGPLEIEGTSLVARGAGVARLQISQPGNEDYLPAPSIIEQLVIGKALQTITLDAPNYLMPGDAPTALRGTASSGLPVSLSIVSGPGELIEGSIKPFGEGEIHLRVTQSGNDYYESASLETIVRVLSLPQLSWKAAVGRITLWWTNSYEGFVLEQGAAIHGPWARVVTAPASKAGTFVIEVDLKGRIQFFRLAR